MDSNYENMNLFDFLRLICNKLALLAKWILNLFLALTHLCFRYWYVMILCVALGFFGARVWMKPKYTRYHGQATISYVPKMRLIVQEGLQSYLSQSFETKRDVFELPDSVQLAMRKFKMYNVIDARNDFDADYIDKEKKESYTDSALNVMPDHLTITFDLQGCYDFYSLERSLILWFNSQDYFTKPDKRYKQAIRERIEYIQYEIHRTDSFMNHLYFSDAPQIQIYNDMVIEQRTPLLHDKMLLLYGEMHYLQNLLVLNPDVINFQSHFYVKSLVAKQKYIIGLCSGFVLGILISLLIKYWANVKKFILTK